MSSRQLLPFCPFKSYLADPNLSHVVQIESETAVLFGKILHGRDSRPGILCKRNPDIFQRHLVNRAFRQAVDIAGSHLRIRTFHISEGK